MVQALAAQGRRRSLLPFLLPFRGWWILQGRYEAGLADLGTFSFYSPDHVHSGAWFITTGYRL